MKQPTMEQKFATVLGGISPKSEVLVEMKSPHGGVLKLIRAYFDYSVYYEYGDDFHLVQGGFATKHDALEFMMKECA